MKQHGKGLKKHVQEEVQGMAEAWVTDQALQAASSFVKTTGTQHAVAFLTQGNPAKEAVVSLI